MLNVKITVAGVCLAFAAQLFAHGEHKSTSDYSLEPVRGNIQLLAGLGGNIAVITGEQGIVLVDDGYANKAELLHDALAALGGEEKLAYIINTHWHGDHTEGNLALGKYAAIIGHDNVLKRLSSAQEIALFKMKSEAYPIESRPSLTYAESMRLHYNGEQMDLVHYPNGHTDSDSVVYFKQANVVHMGDHFFNSFFPFVDVANGGNVVNYANNVGAVLAKINADTLVIPGHGALSNKAELQAFYKMLRGTIAEVKAMQAKGYSLEKMQRKGLSKQWDKWAVGFVSESAWVQFIHASL